MKIEEQLKNATRDDARDIDAPAEQLRLSSAAEFLLNECRMVLPGIQALFGFQLIAVFNPRFSGTLGHGEQYLHLLAIALVATGIALIMTPAAYHRQMNPKEVTEAFIRVSTRLLLWSMLPLCLGICADFYLVSSLIVEDGLISLLMAVVLFAVFFIFWFVLPRAEMLRRAISSRGRAASRADDERRYLG